MIGFDNRMTGVGLAYHPQLEAVGSESGLWSGPDGRVSSKTLPDPAIHWYCRTVEYPRPPYIR